MSVTAFARSVVLAAALTVFAACNSNPLIVEITDCPAVGFVRYANTVTVFADENAPRPENTLYRAIMSNLDVDCQDRGEGLRTKVEFTITAEPGPTTLPARITLPYFVVVARSGDDLQSKEIYSTTIRMDGRDGRGQQRETLEFSIPTNELADQYAYEVLVGFELSNTQARFNLES